MGWQSNSQVAMVLDMERVGSSYKIIACRLCNNLAAAKGAINEEGEEKGAGKRKGPSHTSLFMMMMINSDSY